MLELMSRSDMRIGEVLKLTALERRPRKSKNFPLLPIPLMVLRRLSGKTAY